MYDFSLSHKPAGHGAGDKFISVATAPLKDVVDFVMKHPVKA